MKKKYFLGMMLWMMGCCPIMAQNHWVGTWATAAEWTGPSDMPKCSLAGKTIRQIIRTSISGGKMRMKLSNELSDQPVEITGLYLQMAGDTTAVSGKPVVLKFKGKKNVTIPAHQAIYTDEFVMNTPKLSRIAVTLSYGKQVPEHFTSHRGSRTTTYITDKVVKPGKPFASIEKVDHWYNIAALEVEKPETTHAVAILGNSITDGRGSTTNLQNRWPDFLATNMNADGKAETGVLNLGIGGNCVVAGGISEPALKRFDRDILGQKGVDRLIIFEGTNDIGCCGGNYEKVAQSVIDAYKVLIDKAHGAGIKVYGATITPTKGNGWYSYFHDAMRMTINDWIRNSKAFDGVIDFDQACRDPKNPVQLLPAYSEDWLHLNPKGYEKMGEFCSEELAK